MSGLNISIGVGLKYYKPKIAFDTRYTPPMYSCFGTGEWINAYPWINSDTWKMQK